MRSRCWMLKVTTPSDGGSPSATREPAEDLVDDGLRLDPVGPQTVAAAALEEALDATERDSGPDLRRGGEGREPTVVIELVGEGDQRLVLAAVVPREPGLRDPGLDALREDALLVVGNVLVRSRRALRPRGRRRRTRSAASGGCRRRRRPTGPGRAPRPRRRPGSARPRRRRRGRTASTSDRRTGRATPGSPARRA